MFFPYSYWSNFNIGYNSISGYIPPNHNPDGGGGVPNKIPLIPILSSGFQDGASADSFLAGGGEPWFAFDNDDTTTWYSQDELPSMAWIQYQFSRPQTAIQYRVVIDTAGSDVPDPLRSFYLLGDGNIIDTQLEPLADGTYTIPAPGSYSTYRIQFNNPETTQTANWNVFTFQLYGYIYNNN